MNTIPTTATFTMPSIHHTSKVPIDRIKSSSIHVEKPAKVRRSVDGKRIKGSEGKKSRVEHVVIEKRYRMKITDSLNELKIMLPGVDDKKVIGRHKIIQTIYIMLYWFFILHKSVFADLYLIVVALILLKKQKHFIVIHLHK